MSSHTEQKKTGRKIYFSATIRGENPDPELAFKVVTHLQSRGHDVLSEHVGSRTREEMDAVLQKRSGVDRKTLSPMELSRFFRKVDTEWVDACDEMVVVLTGASLGVGMEIERALLKPERGLNQTPVVCFVPESYYPSLSAMVGGIVDPLFTLKTFSTYEDIKAELDSIF